MTDDIRHEVRIPQVGLPKLTGTEAQVRYAQDLRAKAYAAHEPEKWIHAFLQDATDARFWIERKANSIRDLVGTYRFFVHEIERATDPGRKAAEKERLRAWLRPRSPPSSRRR